MPLRWCVSTGAPIPAFVQLFSVNLWCTGASQASRLLQDWKSEKLQKKELRASGVYPKLTAQEIRDLQFIFNLSDTEDLGSLNSKQTLKALELLGFMISEQDLSKIRKQLDLKDGKTTFQAFQVLVAERRGDPYDHYEEIIQGFHIIDCDNDGKITVGNLSHACQLAGLHFSRQELDAMVEEADRDGDHAVNLTEFTNVMLKTNLF
ncbi:caltractin-like isoform X2 [Rhinatrema bivittatum]|uniref:caltractin-like isoform X2 n=1 Tax=Rhinatrema bivittatum TaxID=194408 RepID=UPI001125FA3D|nr:caltractin-like isoform X2 [Rhinatrema bivittatum]